MKHLIEIMTEKTMEERYNMVKGVEMSRKKGPSTFGS